MKKTINADICVIGGGSGGLSVAAGAAQLGATTVLIERDKMGGDCLNYGCVPSKSLIAAAAGIKSYRSNVVIDTDRSDFHYDFRKIHDHIRRAIETIEPHDSVERFEGLGVQVIKGSAVFNGPDQLSVDDTTIRAKRFVIATGSRPRIPPIPGLEAVEYETNETIFANTELTDHLLVIGGGPIGCEITQAYRRLGAKVTLFDIGPILPKDDPDLVETVRQAMHADGVQIRDCVNVVRIEPGPTVVIEQDGVEEAIEGSKLLLAVGRQPNIDDMGLDAAGVQMTKAGIEVDRRLRTTNKKIFAIGDVAGGLQFTHVAGYHAGIVIRNALFRIPAKASNRAIPWVTYTSPELAHVGVSSETAKEQGLEVLTWSFTENDRAIAERHVEGGIKVVIGKRGQILGATIVGPHAGELIFAWTLAVDQKMNISKMAAVVAPYPTRSEISKRVAGSYFTPKLFNERMRKIVGWLLKLPF